MKHFFSFFKVDDSLKDLAEECLAECNGKFNEISETTAYNQQKMLASFIQNRVSESHFAGSTGYGYNDRGRETIEKVFAQAVGAEDALFRHNFMSGTHALTVALFGVLRPGDTVLSATGIPYDTIHGVFGIRPAPGSLAEFGVSFEAIPLDASERPDRQALVERLQKSKVRMVYIQRSRGYSLRPSLSVESVSELAAAVKTVSPDTVIMVDNCYGEFVERIEPTAAGADLMAGSLIKNPGGGIAPTGGYIAGKAELVEQCANRLTAPGTGGEIGCTLGLSRELYLGLFNAPHAVGEALKTAVFTAALFHRLGFPVSPMPQEKRCDIIQSVTLQTPEGLCAFCRGMQSGAPVDSFVTPEPWDMPGYDNQVIMAAGTFTMGASIELSADGPMREPYAAWMQGGIQFDSAAAGVLLAAQSMLEKGLLPSKNHGQARKSML